MSLFSAAEVSPARMLAAGQRGEVLDVVPEYGTCKPAEVPGKGRGLIAAAHVPAGGLLLCEPAVAAAPGQEELAAELLALTEGGDEVLLGQLLLLAAWGEAPGAVPPLADADAATFLARRAPGRDPGQLAAARELLGGEADGDGAGEGEFRSRLLARLRLIVRANAFRSAVDPLGALAWHALAPAEQDALATADPGKVPCTRLSLFLRASLINHSEAPNAAWLVAGGVIAVRATEVIPAGKEVLVSYWPDVDALDAHDGALLEGYGMSGESVGPAPELRLGEAEREQLRALKRLPSEWAQQLAGAGAAGRRPEEVFDEVAAAMAGQLSAAEKALPGELRAFLEPRFLQAQLTLQQGAVLSARGDPQGEKLLALGLARMRSALRRFPGPWGQRVLLRLIFALKGTLRPAPADELAAAGAERRFFVRLSAQARATEAELHEELARAVGDSLGEPGLAPAVLAKCGVASQ